LFEAEYISGKRAGTAKNYANAFNQFERLSNPGSLRSISARTISQYVGAMRKQPTLYGDGMKESSIRIRLKYLHSALAWAVKQELIPKCPEFPTILPPKRKPQPVPVESFERLLAKAPDEQTRVFLLSGWLAGLRLNEAYSLEWDETEEAPYVDFARDRIVFPADIVKAVEDQWVPLDPELRDALLALPRHGRKVFRFVDLRPDCRQGRILKSNSVGGLIRDLAQKAGVRLTMKSLRRGFGCYWASRVPAQVLQKLMRHSNIRITMDYYANVDDAAMTAVLTRPRNTSCNSDALNGQEQAKEDATKPDTDEICD
jgi:integrase